MELTNFAGSRCRKPMDVDSWGQFDTPWRRSCDRDRDRRRDTRSQSVSGTDRFTAREISRIRERLGRIRTGTKSGSIRSLTAAQKMALAALAIVDFVSFASMSVMAPFFPREAAVKGMSATESGLVFSFYALVMFLASPICGRLLPQLGARFVIAAGMFMAGGCSLLFGLLSRVENYAAFAALCFALRGLEAVGASAYATASYVFVAEIFPDNIGTVLGILETFVGLGMSMGPAIGGLLFSVGGFSLPFYVLGIVMMLAVPLCLGLLPDNPVSPVNRKAGSLLLLAQNPRVAMASIVVVTVSSTWGFLDPTLEPHLRQFSLSPEQVGLVFLLFAALYGLSSPLWGLLSDAWGSHWAMMAVGSSLSAIGLLLLGPSPLLPMLPSCLWLSLVALSLLGISVALALLPTFQCLLEAGGEGGSPGDRSSCAMLAGLWSAMYSLGEVIGPGLGGALAQFLGFPTCCTVMALANAALAIAATMFSCCCPDDGCPDTTLLVNDERREREDSPLIPATDKVSYYENNNCDSMATVAMTPRGACEV